MVRELITKIHIHHEYNFTMIMELINLFMVVVLIWTNLIFNKVKDLNIDDIVIQWIKFLEKFYF